jgi:hypothetical protein
MAVAGKSLVLRIESVSLGARCAATIPFLSSTNQTLSLGDGHPLAK